MGLHTVSKRVQQTPLQQEARSQQTPLQLMTVVSLQQMPSMQ
jgi:hypothetical protein